MHILYLPHGCSYGKFTWHRRVMAYNTTITYDGLYTACYITILTYDDPARYITTMTYDGLVHNGLYTACYIMHCDL